ncbi:WGR domain-containing protein [Spirulina sp. CCNP1310]|uniref:WGR domain-containing protein n=1 Tax=Spirulina sp. CCNP1310 TaxID=3110249 RepID=UPI002B201922|nr:WGR domain-containing protein [Spirulina sp. CCNP1310]
MSDEKIYLELSEAEGAAHKFYEVAIAGTEVTIRYGRIGDPGQSKTSSYPTAEKAKAEADKKVKEKLKKGYAPAVMGERQKRPLTRRDTTSQRSKAQSAPILWQFNSGAIAFGIFINDQACWVGNQRGQVFALDFQGQVFNQFQLPEGVKCLVADDIWFYAGCDDGNVYDISGKVPHLAYEIEENVDIYWLDIADGLLAVSDGNGQVALFHPEDEFHWTRLSTGKGGWMVRCDRTSVYHGHSNGVTCYDIQEGRVQWHQDTKGSILFGWQEAATIYGGTSAKLIYAWRKTGESLQTYRCDAAVYSCATAQDGRYVFAGDSHSSVYCFNGAGERLWKLGTGCGSALSMQWHQERLYIVTTNGYLACLDVSEAAILAAKSGNLPKTQEFKAPKTAGIAVSTALQTTTEAGTGILLRCIQEAGKLRVRVVSPGYQPDWNVQFPRNLREEGAQYIVTELRESAQGSFYRVYGEIKKFVDQG